MPPKSLIVWMKVDWLIPAFAIGRLVVRCSSSLGSSLGMCNSMVMHFSWPGRQAVRQSGNGMLCSPSWLVNGQKLAGNLLLRIMMAMKTTDVWGLLDSQQLQQFHRPRLPFMAGHPDVVGWLDVYLVVWTLPLSLLQSWALRILTFLSKVKICN